MKLKLGRRGFVRGLGIAGAGAMATPFLTSAPGRAEDAFPTRFLVFFSPNGTIPEEWSPDGGERDFVLRRILEPLEPHREDLLILDGLDIDVGSAPARAHERPQQRTADHRTASGCGRP